jgi:monofunctional glycosyltransferase
VLLLRFVPPPTTSFMLQAALRNGPYAYNWQPYPQISPDMALAAIAAEDQRFPIHSGFDVDAINAALRQAENGASLRGASTISQQVAKNLFLWPGGGFVRKGIEAWLTLLIELMWDKQRILEMYLNIAQFSDHTFGVEAASQQFFQISAQDLTPEEAALLAAVLPGPELYSLDAPSWEVLDRQDWILTQMSQLGGTAYLQRLQDDS